MNKIIEKYHLEKSQYLGYEYELYLENLKTKWHLSFEKPTRKCKFYTLYTRFENTENLKGKIECNLFNGKCNRFLYSLKEIEDFINEVINLKGLV